MEQTSLAIASAMIFTTLFSFACAPSFDAITSCRPVRISRAEEAEAVGMGARYQKARALSNGSERRRLERRQHPGEADQFGVGVPGLPQDLRDFGQTGVDPRHAGIVRPPHQAEEAEIARLPVPPARGGGHAGAERSE